jgi:hypothetical protein
MSVNKQRPHLLVLPEDDANRQIVEAFAQTLKDQRMMQALPIAGGWLKVIEDFEKNEIAGLRNFPHRMLLLLIDCDEKPDRIEYVKTKIPPELQGRVFVLGVLSEPERLKSNVKGGYETIGKKLAEDCVDDTNITWGHALLTHNHSELARLVVKVKPILF